ncbi:hypothetical protein MKW92_031537, partial [Papaver armeniacum]
LPNILGFIFGISQMILYPTHRGRKQPKIVEDNVVEISTINAANASTLLNVAISIIEDVQEQLAKEKNIRGAVLYQYQNVVEV